MTISTTTDNNPALAGNSGTKRPGQQGRGIGAAQVAAEVFGSGGQDDTVTVSRAAQLLSQQPSERGQGMIQSADQAAQLAKGLRALFEGNSGQALVAQSVNLPPDLMELLNAG